MPIQSTIDRDICDNDITLDEFSKDLKLLQIINHLGLMGSLPIYINKIWKDIKDLLFESFKHSFETKQLSSFQRMGILNLLTKKDKDLR